MAKICRRASYDNKKIALEHHKTFSIEEIEDVLELIATKQWPDSKFSDDECSLWSIIRRMLQIQY